jgi:hypothetical protein
LEDKNTVFDGDLRSKIFLVIKWFLEHYKVYMNWNMDSEELGECACIVKGAAVWCVCVAANVLAVESSLSFYILVRLFHVPDTERRHLGDLRYQHNVGHSVAQVVICWLSVQKPIFSTMPVCCGLKDTIIVQYSTVSQAAWTNLFFLSILDLKLVSDILNWCSKWQNGITLGSSDFSEHWINFVWVPQICYMNFHIAVCFLYFKRNIFWLYV